MKIFRITNGFDRMTDAYLLVRASFIRDSIAANPSAFPTPSPTLADIGENVADFQTAVHKAETGNRQDIAVKNDLRQALINQLHLLGNYVLFTAAGDEVIATSSGFNISKQPAPRPAITNPDGLSLKNGINRGELELSFKRVAGANAYLYEITPSPITDNSNWETVMTTITKNLFDGLESGKEYNCRVAAIGVKQQMAYSNVVSRIAL